jgi:3-hydroxyacyl-[acyl-carrier-protein] dehydratase
LLRETDHFDRPVIMLKEVRNVKYGTFVAPGQTLVLTVSLEKQIDDHTYKLKGQGTVDGKSAVSGVMICDQFRLSDRYGTPESMDRVCRREYRSVYVKLQPPIVVEAT